MHTVSMSTSSMSCPVREQGPLLGSAEGLSQLLATALQQWLFCWDVWVSVVCVCVGGCCKSCWLDYVQTINPHRRLAPVCCHTCRGLDCRTPGTCNSYPPSPLFLMCACAAARFPHESSGIKSFYGECWAVFNALNSLEMKSLEEPRCADPACVSGGG